MKVESIKSLEGCLSDYVYTSNEDWDTFNKLVKLALKQTPMKVNVEKWIYTVCPSCGIELSVHHGDGYYSIKNEVEWCQNCGQKLDWGW